MAVKLPWNDDDAYFFTHNPFIEIKTVEDLFYYANQEIGGDWASEFDAVGRGRVDRLFLRLCTIVHCCVGMISEDMEFKFFSCKKDGDKYIARVQYRDGDLEMEMSEMIDHFNQLNDAWLAAYDCEEAQQ